MKRKAINFYLKVEEKKDINNKKKRRRAGQKSCFIPLIKGLSITVFGKINISDKTLANESRYIFNQILVRL